ncbi:MAG TPA: hypothetical protein VK250_06370 [Nitrososphaeraceae archaeon]|nr:hypothetical protein [Nitrososphaeraceae archaeon]
MFKKIILDLPIMYLAPEIKSRNLSPTDFTKYCVNRMEKFDPCLKAFITVEKECALEDAYCVKKEIKKGNWTSTLQSSKFISVFIYFIFFIFLIPFNSVYCSFFISRNMNS